MEVDVITRTDLETFKTELLEAMVDKLAGLMGEETTTKDIYFRSAAAREFLGGVSEGSLYNLRTRGLPFTKIGGIYLYSKQDLLQFAKDHRIDYSKDDLI